MDPAGKVIVVTGGGSGIGKALCSRFAAAGAKAVTVADLDVGAAEATGAEITAHAPATQALALGCDVAREADVKEVVGRTAAAFGPIDLLCSNAGIGCGGGIEASDEEWQRAWQVHVMAHVYAARAVLPGMVARGEGYFLTTASAAGLLTNLGNAPYSVTKHGTVALTEWLAITYGDAGIRASCLCPQGVRTPMLLGGLDTLAGAVVAAGGALLEPEEVAEAVIEGLADERFLILPHPEVHTYLSAKVADSDRWLAGMRKLQARLSQTP